MLKRIINFIPFTTIALIVGMYMGMKMATHGTGHVVDYSWASTPGEWFTMSNVKALFGHVGMGHFLNNASIFALFSIPAEICLGTRRYTILQLVLMSVYYMADTGITDALHLNSSMGASGWAMMAPGVMVFCAAWRMNKAQVSLAALSVPMSFYGISVMCIACDIRAVGTSDGVSHESHIVGYVVGSVTILFAIPYMWKAGKVALAEMREKAYWDKKASLRAMQWQLEDYRNGRLRLSPRTVKRYEKALAA